MILYLCSIPQPGKLPVMLPPYAPADSGNAPLPFQTALQPRHSDNSAIPIPA